MPTDKVSDRLPIMIVSMYGARLSMVFTTLEMKYARLFISGVEDKDHIVTRLNIRVRYHNRVLSFHLTKTIPIRSIFDRIYRWALEYMYTLDFEIKKNNGHIFFQMEKLFLSFNGYICPSLKLYILALPQETNQLYGNFYVQKKSTQFCT